MNAPLVSYAREGRIAAIRLNRPEKLNAINDDLAVELRRAAARFDDDADAWVAVLSGEGRAFSTGADVRQRHLRSDEELRALDGPVGTDAALDDVFMNCSAWKPVIVAVHGYAIGLALSLMLDADIAVVSRSTRMQCLQTGRGLSPAKYWAKFAVRGHHAFADDVCLTGRWFGPEEAHRAGVIARVVDDGDHLDAAYGVAKEILACPPLGVREGTRMRRMSISHLESDLAVIRRGRPSLHLTEDFRESARSFAEKREPRPWTGR